jgi:hypothetical protein
MAKDEQLAKCGRGFYRFCDSDDNRRVTISEWLQCAGISGESTFLIFRFNGKITYTEI